MEEKMSVKEWAALAAIVTAINVVVWVAIDGWRALKALGECLGLC